MPPNGPEPFPFSADAGAPEGEAKLKADGEALQTNQDVATASGRRTHLIRDVMYNYSRNSGTGRVANFFDLLGRLRGLFYRPRDNPQGGRNAALLRTQGVMNLIGAVRNDDSFSIPSGQNNPNGSPIAAEMAAENGPNAVRPNLSPYEINRRFTQISRQLQSMNLIGRQIAVQPNGMVVAIPRGGHTYRFMYSPNGTINVVASRPGPGGRGMETRALQPITQWNVRVFERYVGGDTAAYQEQWGDNTPTEA